MLTKASGSDLDTAWTAPAMGYESIATLNGTTALTSADHGKVFRANITAADITATLPSAASLPSGWFTTIGNYWFSTMKALIDAGAGVSIIGGGGTSQTITLPPGQQLKLICDGADWYVDGDIWHVAGAMLVKVGGADRVLGPANNSYRKLTFSITSGADASAAHGLGREPLYLTPI